MASMATSIEAEQTFTKNPKALSVDILIATSVLADDASDRMSKLTRRPDIHAIIHGRRNPKLWHVMLSMMGPMKGLKLHGKKATALKLAAASTESDLMSHTGSAMESNPLGAPSAK